MHFLKEQAIDLKNWFFDLNVPVFDKICAMSVGIFLIGMVVFAILSIGKLFIMKPALFFTLVIGIFLAIAISYLIVKYLD